jgi:hypothetical protein
MFFACGSGGLKMKNKKGTSEKMKNTLKAGPSSTS